MPLQPPFVRFNRCVLCGYAALGSMLFASCASPRHPAKYPEAPAMTQKAAAVRLVEPKPPMAFHFRFKDQQNTRREVHFSLPAATITAAQQELLNYTALAKLVKQNAPKLISAANQAAQPERQALQRAYDARFKGMQTGFPEGFSLKVKVAGKVQLGYKLGPPPNYGINAYTELPGFSSWLQTEAARQKNLQRIEQLAAEINLQLPDSAHIKIERTQNQGYRVRYGGGRYAQAELARVKRLHNRFQKNVRSLHTREKQHLARAQKHHQALLAKWNRYHQTTLLPLTAKAYQQLHAIHGRVYQKEVGGIYRRHYIVSTKTQNQQTLSIDYTRLARTHTPSLKPLGDRLAKFGITPRERIEATLHFFQAIPYDTLKNRGLKTMGGFATPVTLLTLNKGDCDTKATAFLALLPYLITQPKAIMLTFLKPVAHALVGVALPPQKGDATLRHQGITYVLMEPVGPKRSRVGQVHGFSQTGIHHPSRQITTL